MPCEMKFSTSQTDRVNKFCGAFISANISFVTGPLGRTSFALELQEA